MKTDHPPIPPGQDMIRYDSKLGVLLFVKTSEGQSIPIYSNTPEGRYVIAAVAKELLHRAWTKNPSMLYEDEIIEHCAIWRAWGGLDK